MLKALIKSRAIHTYLETTAGDEIFVRLRKHGTVMCIEKHDKCEKEKNGITHLRGNTVGSEVGHTFPVYIDL